MTEPRESRHAHRHRIGRRILHYDCVTSTNDEAFNLAGDPAQVGTVVTARTQSQGRGRLGRRWHAPVESSVLMSVLLPAEAGAWKPTVLTALAAVAVCAALRSLCGLQVRIKWPNDIYLVHQKISGILIEQRRQATVIGIGLNVNQSRAEFTADNLASATSLRIACDRTFVIDDVLAAVVDELDQGFNQIEHGNLHGLQNAWVDALRLLRPEVVSVSTEAAQHVGRIETITFDSITMRCAGSPGLVALDVIHVKSIRDA